MGPDQGAKKVLETATIKTLHAHNFSRASSQATSVMTDLLSRYFTVLTETCARYADHAGRTRLTAKDAIRALDDLGVDMEELSQYCATEGRELSRFAVHTGRRMEDLNEFKGRFRRSVPACVRGLITLFSIYFLRASGGSR